MATRDNLDEIVSPNLYYCHVCSRNVQSLSEDYTCPTCHSGFVELVENPPAAAPRNSNSAIYPNPDRQRSNSNSSDMDAESFVRLIASPLLNNLFSHSQQQQQQQQPGSSASASASTAATAQAAAAAGTSSGLNAGSAAQNNSSTSTLPTGFQNFLQTLFQGLTNDGTLQVQFHINNGEGGASFAFPFPLHGNTADYAWGPGGIDAIVTQLLNQVEGGTPPMEADKIKTLPEVTITKEQIEKRLQCAVCMDDFKLDETVIRLMCEHLFHKGCIIPWLEKHNSCPICRKSAETGQPVETPPVNPQNTFFGGWPAASQSTSASATTGATTAATTTNTTATTSNTSSSNRPSNTTGSTTTQQPNQSGNSSSDRPQWMDIEDLD